MTSQTDLQKIAMHILPNISQSKRQPENGIWSINII